MDETDRMPTGLTIMGPTIAVNWQQHEDWMLQMALGLGEVRQRLEHLESREMPPSFVAFDQPGGEPIMRPLEPSSAPIPGTVQRLFEWLVANRPSSQGQLVLTAQIWGSFRSTSFTADELEEMFPYFSTQLQMSELPMPSTPITEDGDRGPASPEVVIREAGLPPEGGEG